jgi:hypothetical protein
LEGVEAPCCWVPTDAESTTPQATPKSATKVLKTRCRHAGDMFAPVWVVAQEIEQGGGHLPAPLLYKLHWQRNNPELPMDLVGTWELRADVRLLQKCLQGVQLRHPSSIPSRSR